MNTGILKAEGLCKSYGSKRVLEGLDLTIQPGRIYGLIGRNRRINLSLRFLPYQETK